MVLFFKRQLLLLFYGDAAGDFGDAAGDFLLGSDFPQGSC